jgi:hypothetical protein
MSCPVISPTLYLLQTMPSGQMICPAKWISPTFTYCKHCTLGKMYVLLRISLALYVLQQPSGLKKGSCIVIPPHFTYCEPCPLGKLYVLPSDFFYTSHSSNPAHWENYMSYLVISPTLYVLQSLPIGKILCPVSDLSYAFKYRKTCPLGNFYVLPSDLSYTLRTRNAARWADSAS